MRTAIRISNLKKSYGQTVALKGIDLTINEGEFFGLLGPNGAGKTTSINILTGLVLKDSGITEIFNRDTVKDYRFTRSQVGVSSQELSMDWFFPLERLLYFQAGYYGITKLKAKPKVDELLERMGLNDKRKSRLRELSGGMKRRFQIAKALVHDPNIIIFDEPTAGVDVELRHELWAYFKSLHKQGKTILLTTHYIEEAEMLCEKISILDKGVVITEGTPKELTRKLGRAGITINLTGWKDELEKALESYQYTRDNGRLHFTVQDPEEVMPEIIAKLTKHGCFIQRVKTTKSSLEDVFLSLTGKGINE